MVYDLPIRDEPDWDAKLNASIDAVKATADAAAAKANNLSDLASATTARTNLGLGDSATKNTGTAAGTVAAGDDSRITGAAQKASNLSDLANAATARTNLGLGNVDNTSDANKPVSTATQTALDNRGKARNLEDYPGVDPTGTTECRTAIQAAIDAASTAGVPIVANAGSFFKIATGITLTNNADLSRAVFNYTGTTGIAITIGAVGTITRKTIRAPYVTALAKTVTGWAQVAGTVGVKILNATVCEIHVPDVSNFETGILIYGDGSGTAWNDIHLGNVVNNKVNLKFDATASGFTNQNTIRGGRFNHQSAEGTLVSGTRHVQMTTSTFVADGNTFLGTSLESTGVVEEIIDSYGWYNEFIGCRFENAGATRKIHWRGTAKGNVIRGGYEAEKLTVTADAGTTNNSIVSPFVDQSIWVPASTMVLASGGPALAQVGGVPYWVLRDAFTDEVAAEVLIPSGWSKVDVTLIWFSQNGAAGNVGLQGKTQSHAAGGSVGFGSFAGAGATVAAPAANVAAATKIGAGVAVTPGPMHFSALRDGTAGTDTSAGNVGLLGIRLDRVA